MKKICIYFVFLLLWAGQASAKIDLTTLPDRDSVQLTIYNSADLTLAQESRSLTLKAGFNDLQFSWANTLIDPTSLEIIPVAEANQIDVRALVFPPRVKDLGLWRINSAQGENVPVQISYLTSGLSWRAFYLGTLTPDEKMMTLKGYVRVMNQSGEDYANAQIRLIVGKVHIIDQIAHLAQRPYPYGAPLVSDRGLVGGKGGRESRLKLKNELMLVGDMAAGGAMPSDSEVFRGKAKEIVKEGLSEYFLYTIEGRETVLNGWSKRLLSFDVADVPVVNLYKYEEERYGQQVVRFLSFKNDEAHQLGETPIPGGVLKVFRYVDENRHLSYEGQSQFKYIPVDEDVELNLGGVRNVIVEPVLMDMRTDNYMFDRQGNIVGWDELREYKMTVKNTRPIPVKIEIKRNIPHPKWTVQNQGDAGSYEKVDADTIEYNLDLNPEENTDIVYLLRTFHGRRADVK
jgi:hypothetical protein